MGNYRIVEAQYQIAGGLAGHDLIAVLNPAGNVIEEYDGLATRGNTPIMIGYLPSDTLQVYNFDYQNLYSSTEPQALLVSSTTLGGLSPYLTALAVCKNDINSENLSYPFMGLGANSNSVASTMDACMGVAEPYIPNSALLTPGVGTLVLPASTIQSIASGNALNVEPLTGDNYVTGESTGTTSSTVNVSNGEGTTAVATLGELTTKSGVVEGNDSLIEKNSVGTTIETESGTVTSTGVETMNVATTGGNQETVSGTNDEFLAAGQTSIDVMGTGDSIYAKGTGNYFTQVSVNGNNDVLITGGNQDNVTILNNADTLTVDSTYSSIGGGNTTGDDVIVNADHDSLTLASGNAVNFESNTNNNSLTGSGDTIQEGSSSDNKIIGGSDTVTLGTGDKVEADGSGDVFSGSNDTIDLASGETLTITGSNDNIVGAGSDTIHATGTSDHVYADASVINFSGTDTGDIVYGTGDNGTDWGGYVDQGGSYGGYGGGGYYGAVRARLVASSHAARSGVADIAAIGGSDHGALQIAGVDLANNSLRFADSGLNPVDVASADEQVALTASPVSSSATAYSANVPLTASLTTVDQLIHAMAAWQPRPSSAIFSADTASSTPNLLAVPFPMSRLQVDSHAHLA